MKLLPPKPYYVYLFSAFAGYWLLNSCSQQKNTFVNRNYHNLTARYNGLYWANVNLQEGIHAMEKAHHDDYSKLLPVFRYADDKTARANYPKFDKAIEKNSKMIQYHSMMIKGKEYCKWIDENYITMGKAHFYKRDYYAAVEVFEYVVKVFPNDPSRYDAFLWMIRAFNQMNSVIKTGPILDMLEHDKNFPRKKLAEYHAVRADYFLRTEQYKKGIDALTKAITLTKKKTTRGRYIYILSQLYEQEGDLKKASFYYSQSASLHPSYEMEFNARLSKARTFQSASGKKAEELKNELLKMLKDDKNKEYLDQIYYALGDLVMKEPDVNTALEYFKMAAQKSVTNTRQKAASYLRAAEIYFERKDYKNAQAYYDSTMAFLPKDYKNYELIKIKSESLTQLVEHLSVIASEDSLLRVAKMDTVHLYALIDGIIQKLIEEEEKKKQEQATKEQLSSGSSATENNPWQTASSTGAWYFYNPSALSFGFSEFYKKWGNRPLEDNWRRKVKAAVFAEEKPLEQADTATEKIADNKTREYYLKNIPFSTDQKAHANRKILEAYYNLGSVYREQLRDNPKAAETFEELLNRFPENKYKLNLYYQLYRIYLAIENHSKANFYKDKILKEHPDSEYSKIIINPDYQKALKASRNEIENYYQKTYRAYSDGKFGEVIAMVSRADSFYSASELMPKFALLRAFSIGKTQAITDYENALQGVIAKYPKDITVRNKAQELLDQAKKFKSASVNSSSFHDTVKTVSPYTFQDSAEHWCLILLPVKKVNINEFKIRVSDFNAEYFRLASLQVSNMLFNDETVLIMVKKFSNASKAIDYIDLLNGDRKVFKNLLPGEYEIFASTSENFPTFYHEKKPGDYKKFFEEEYLKKK